jgi:hypothetical protein
MTEMTSMAMTWEDVSLGTDTDAVPQPWYLSCHNMVAG